MKKLFLIAISIIAASSLILFSCQKDTVLPEVNGLTEVLPYANITADSDRGTLSVEDIKKWFETEQITPSNFKGVDTSIFKPEPKWELAYNVKSPNGSVLTIIPIVHKDFLIKKSQQSFSDLGTANVIVTKSANNVYKGAVVMTIADENYNKLKKGRVAYDDYSGHVCIFDAKGNFKDGVHFINGKRTGSVNFRKKTGTSTLLGDGDRGCITVEIEVDLPCDRVFVGDCGTAILSSTDCGSDSNSDPSGGSGLGVGAGKEGGGGGSIKLTDEDIANDILKQAQFW
jgi:hypothetical protein